MKTMLDKCAVAGDITQAIDRRGAWSCAVTVIGGTESTAVKLQSADSANGEFTDFKTLISADDAEADQYKGFVIDLSGAGNFIKIVGATMATCVLGDCDHDVKTVAIKAGEIPSGADLEDNKTATIDVSTYTEPVEIEPTEGKDGMKKATVTLSNIPSGGGVTLYAWVGSNDVLPRSITRYFDFNIAPSDMTEFNATKCIQIDQNSPVDYSIVVAQNTLPEGYIYEKSSDGEFHISDGAPKPTDTVYIRDATKDVEVW